jgi:ketosteroid isomerase-like protein
MAGVQDVDKLIRDAYAARRLGDVDAVLACFTDQPVFAIAGSTDASPVACRADCSNSLRNALTQLVSAFEFVDQDIRSILVDGDKAAVHWHGRIRSSRTGEEADTEVLDLIRVENGKIASFTQFCDTALAARLV